jgi:hypothetical protein
LGKLKELLLPDEYLIASYPEEYWITQDGRLVLIEHMDFQHLENIVNLFSQEGMTVDPMRQGAFEKIMIRYLRLQAQINDVHKDIL